MKLCGGDEGKVEPLVLKDSIQYIGIPLYQNGGLDWDSKQVENNQPKPGRVQVILGIRKE